MKFHIACTAFASIVLATFTAAIPEATAHRGDLHEKKNRGVRRGLQHGKKPKSQKSWESPKSKFKKKYEVTDQSNSIAGNVIPGTKGSFLWIWDSESIKDQLDNSSDALSAALLALPTDPVTF